MPKKGRGKKKKNGKGKGKKAASKALAATEAEELLKTSKRFIKAYQAQCAAMGTVASQQILKDLRISVENERLLPKFILHTQESSARSKPVASKRKTPAASAASNPPAQTQSSASGESIPSPQTKSEDIDSRTADVVVSAKTVSTGLQIKPLVSAWRELNYHSLRCLHVWNIPLNDEDLVSLALFLESSLGPNLKVLELRDNHLSAWAVSRLARALGGSYLAVLNLDYNRCEQLAVGNLCMGLQSCSTLHSLSLNYCHLDSSAAEPLGSLVASSHIKHLSLIGNSLHCEGASELVTGLVTVAEKGSGQMMPSLSHLYLQDNGIDVLGSKGMFEPVLFTRLLKRWILCSDVVEDINLDGNWIGDGGGRELVLALQQRKEAGLPTIKLTVTHRMSSDIFASIVEMGTPGKKKGRKKGKKKKR